MQALKKISHYWAVLRKGILYFVIFLAGFSFTTVLHAQLYKSAFVCRDTFPESKQLYFSLRSVSFFHNNEFFHPLVKGYTLTGTWLQPELDYAFSKEFYGSFGFHLLKYNGIESFSRKLPVFSFTYSPLPVLSVTLGNYPGGRYHKISEVLYNPERHLSLYPEGGLSARLNTQSVEAEIWINWERMIRHGDPFNEDITAGASSRIRISGSQKNMSIILPLQIIGKHNGGQINTGARSTNTWWNMLTGIEAGKKFEGKYFRELKYILHFPLYYHENETGFGIFPQMEGSIFGNKISAGYFKAAGLKTIHGIGLYNSYEYIAVSDSFVAGGGTELITFKTEFSKNISKHANLILRFDAWYDVNRSKIDYLSGIYLVVWLDKKIRLTGVNK